MRICCALMGCALTALGFVYAFLAYEQASRGNTAVFWYDIAMLVFLGILAKEFATLALRGGGIK